MNELIEIIKGIYELIMIPTIIVIIIIAIIKSSESKTAQRTKSYQCSAAGMKLCFRLQGKFHTLKS